ncbi:hypothetical protein ACFXG4_33115 [Nocardia sp. NPDC059246]|uniref:hypothetical protein n=1 Tax=unclassified Nocardia TaxID=2637762 RepID=UPI0036B768FA
MATPPGGLRPVLTTYRCELLTLIGLVACAFLRETAGTSLHGTEIPAAERTPVASTSRELPSLSAEG